MVFPHFNLCISTWIKCLSYMLNTRIVSEFIAVCVISYFLFTPARSKAGIVLSNNCYWTCSKYETVAFCQKLKLNAPFLKLFLLPYILQQLDCCKGRGDVAKVLAYGRAELQGNHDQSSHDKWEMAPANNPSGTGMWKLFLLINNLFWGRRGKLKAAAGIQVHVFGVRCLWNKRAHTQKACTWCSYSAS